MPEVITSPSNPKVKQLLALQQKSSARRERGLFVVEGRRELQHCIDAGFIIDTIFVCPTLSETAPLHGGSPLPDFASLIPPLRFAGGPPVHEATGGHGPAGESPRSAAPAAEAETAAASPARSHPRLRKREGPAAAGRGRGPAQPDGWRGRLPRSEGQTKVFEVSEEVYRKISYREGTEGVMAEVKVPERKLEGLELPENPLVMVLESVEKPGNLGAVLRSADAAGADAVLVCDPLTDLWNPNLIRASVGAVFTVPCVTCSSQEAIDWLKARGIRILTAQLQDSSLYYDCDMTVGTALVMGTEATGLTPRWRQAADAHIRIPMLGALDSLNVSVSAAILLFEAVRQRRNG